jgi:hypothetical protein
MAGLLRAHFSHLLQIVTILPHARNNPALACPPDTISEKPMTTLRTRSRTLQRWLLVIPMAVLASGAFGQSADALIHKLVEKGILTVDEANDLRDEADKDFKKAYALKAGTPEWVSALRFNGDVRLRYEGFTSDATVINSGITNKFVDRNRIRYRLRFAGTANFFDNFESGFRLTSGEPTGAFGGNPVSASQTLTDNGSKKFIWIDTVYGKWSPLKGPHWFGSLTAGKMENPLQLSDMIFDPTYTPEGASLQLGYNFTDRQSLKFTGGWFLMDELAFSNSDPNLLAAQIRWDAVWCPKLSTTFGFSGLNIQNAMRLTNNLVPNSNVGNTRTSDETLKYFYNPFVIDGYITYTADSFPLYKGRFPIKIGGEYINNPGTTNVDYFGANAGITFGKAGKRGTWEFGYTYRYLGADAWYEEFTDNDFGAVYQVLPSQFWGVSAPGYYPGTGVKGHIVRFAWSPTDSFTFVIKWYLTELINPSPANSESRMSRLEVDGNFKF